MTNSTQLSSNAWTHVAVTYTNSAVKFYVNGALVDTVSKTYTMGSNNKVFSLSTATQSFDGKLDDVRYYHRALSDTEVGQTYGSQVTNHIYLADALGSIVALTDPTKAIQTEYDYEPFGATTTSGQSNKNAYKFTAREDDGTGLMYYRARYYHPGLGRFVSEDPIGYEGGDFNLYAYVHSNPINWIDPSGRQIAQPWRMLEYYRRFEKWLASLRTKFGFDVTVARVSGGYEVDNGCHYFIVAFNSDYLGMGVSANVYDPSRSALPVEVGVGFAEHLSLQTDLSGITAQLGFGVGGPDPFVVSMELQQFRINRYDNNGCECP